VGIGLAISSFFMPISNFVSDELVTILVPVWFIILIVSIIVGYGEAKKDILKNDE
jgi:hypothetical protein